MISSHEKSKARSRVRCSSFGKTGDEVEHLVAGPTIETAICNECVDLCSEIVAEQRADALKHTKA